MRQIYLDNAAENHLYKISFYSPSEGYAAFDQWIGFTTDSGRTFTKKFIQTNNVDFNGYEVNITFGFTIYGVNAFSQNSLIVYGGYGAVPSILKSTDGGNSFTLVFHSQYDPLSPRGGVTAMIFPSGNSIGFAADPDRILKTTDGGTTWSTVKVDPENYFTDLDAFGNNTVIAFGNRFESRTWKTTNSGSAWSQMTLPAIPGGHLSYVHFRNATKGWLTMTGDNGRYTFTSADGGNTWTQQNDERATPFAGRKLKFFDDFNGYGLEGENTIYKTSDGGKLWEPLSRDNSLAYAHNDLFFWNATEFWAGGKHGFLEITNNGGGTPIPAAYFKVDTSGFATTGNVSLQNFSKSGYNYKWFVNGQQVSTAYNYAYAHEIFHTTDTVMLVVTNGSLTDTAVKYSFFPPPVIVSAFNPVTAAPNTEVLITGLNFEDVTEVTFGNVPAKSFTVLSPTSIKAIVGAGASGSVRVSTTFGSGAKTGFTFLPPPTITSFSPTSAKAGTTITINGLDFNNASAVSFGGIPASSFTVVSATKITAVAPSSPSGSVSVTSPNGTGSLPGFVALPVITSFSPTNGTQGTIVTITGTSLSELTAITIGGTAAQSFEIISTEKVNAIVGAGASGSISVSTSFGSATATGFTWFPPPAITSFSPSSGPVGTTVIITGTNFNTTPSANTVLFGQVKATVSAATATSLTVTVPAGASFDPITVVSNHLISFSQQPFLVTFANGGSITPNSFVLAKSITESENIPYNIVLSDIDRDGKTDLVAAKTSSGFGGTSGAFIYRNTSTTTDVSFADAVNVPSAGFVADGVGDFDNDGKPDLAILNDETIEIFRNTSVPGSISFVAEDTLAASFFPRAIAINDVDGDGKADIAIPNGLSVYRNTSNPGHIMFADRTDFAAQGGRNILLTDLNGDKKPDAVLPDPLASTILVLKNTSTKGNVSFANAISLPGYMYSYVAAGDIDGDGKTDLVFGAEDDPKVGVLRNTSSSGNLSFASPVQLTIAASSVGIMVNDLDGDGKPDIVNGLTTHEFGVLKNKSTPGNVSFASPVAYTAGSFIGSHMLSTGDINNDGRVDVVSVSEITRNISVYINKVLPEPYITSFSPTFGETGAVITITGENFNNVTSVTFGGTAAASYTVNSPTSITAVLGNGSSGDVGVTNNFGTATKASFSYGTRFNITSFSPASGPVGSTVIIQGNNFDPVAPNNIVYFGGVKATVTSASTNALTVTVPVGATFQPITVTAGGLTAYSMHNFTVTFPGANNASYFKPFKKQEYVQQGEARAVADLDGDGKLDLILIDANKSMAIARNISTPKNVAFAANISFANNDIPPSGFATGDLDGDGKLDVVSVSEADGSFTIWQNTSTMGAPSLSGVAQIYTTTGESVVCIHDIDGDGRSDLIITLAALHTVRIYHNIGTAGHFLFDPQEFPVTGNPAGIAILDADDDGKPEIVITDETADQVMIFPNHSTPRTISLGTGIGYVVSEPALIVAGDINGDGKTDFTTSGRHTGGTAVFLNTTDSTGISFARPQQIFGNGNITSTSMADLDGNGTPDLVAGSPGNGFELYKNRSTSSAVVMDCNLSGYIEETAKQTSVGDIDGDGFPDIVISNDDPITTFYLNRIDVPDTTWDNRTDTVKVCGGADTTFAADYPGSVYKWQQNSGDGYHDIVDNGSISGSTTATLHLANISAAWQGYTYRCITDNLKVGRSFVLDVSAASAASVSLAASDTLACSGQQVVFTATPVDGGSSPRYEWTVNGSTVSETSSQFIVNAWNTSTMVVQVSMTPATACSLSAVVSSNTVTVKMRKADSTTAVIKGLTTVVEGQSAFITSTANAALPALAYQWQDSTRMHTWKNIAGSTAPTIDYVPDSTGSAIRCKITSSGACGAVVLMSNELVFTVNRQMDESSNAVVANPVTNGVLAIDSLDKAANWQSLEIINYQNGKREVVQNISGAEALKVYVGNLSNGVYLVVLRNRNGEMLRLKFVKL